MTPKPGYKLTELGLIPEDWDVKKLGDCLTDSPSYGINAAAVPYSGKLPTYIRITDITDDGQFAPEKLVSVKAANAENYYLNEGDLVFARTGASVGKAYLYNPSDGRLVFAGFLIRVKPNPERLVPEFLNAVVRTGHYWKWVQLMSMRSGQPGINGNEYAQLPIPLPPLSEQRAIATALSEIDEWLHAQETLIAKQRDLKTAAMAQLLNGKTRLPRFAGDWGTKTLGEVAEISMGRTPHRLNAQFWGKGHKWLSIGDMKGKYITESTEEITDLGASLMSVVPKGTLLMSFKLSIGKLGFAGCDLFTNEAICAFHSPKCDPSFLYYQLFTVNFSLYGKQAVKGYTLNSQSLNQVEIKLPPLAEQVAIAEVLTEMDDGVAACEAQLEKARHLKTATMQALLTGARRLV